MASLKLIFQVRCHVSSVNKIPRKPEQGEVEFFTLFDALWRMKYLIAAIAVVCAIIAAFYAYSATREYRVASVLRPIQLKGLDILNRSQIYSLPPEMAIKRFEIALNSYENRLAFYKENSSLLKSAEDSSKSTEQNFESFNRGEVRVTDDSTIPGKSLALIRGLNYSENFDVSEVSQEIFLLCPAYRT